MSDNIQVDRVAAKLVPTPATNLQATRTWVSVYICNGGRGTALNYDVENEHKFLNLALVACDKIQLVNSIVFACYSVECPVFVAIL